MKKVIGYEKIKKDCKILLKAIYKDEGSGSAVNGHMAQKARSTRNGRK